MRRFCATSAVGPRTIREYHCTMQFATGTVVNGKVELQGVALPEGAVVAVVARGADEPFALSREDEEELVAAIAEIESGDYLTVEQLLAGLPKPN
jgi:hypothetical protein